MPGDRVAVLTKSGRIDVVDERGLVSPLAQIPVDELAEGQAVDVEQSGALLAVAGGRVWRVDPAGTASALTPEVLRPVNMPAVTRCAMSRASRMAGFCSRRTDEDDRSAWWPYDRHRAGPGRDRHQPGHWALGHVEHHGGVPCHDGAQRRRRHGRQRPQRAPGSNRLGSSSPKGTSASPSMPTET
jgi:hypothetical protein